MFPNQADLHQIQYSHTSRLDIIITVGTHGSSWIMAAAKWQIGNVFLEMRFVQQYTPRRRPTLIVSQFLVCDPVPNTGLVQDVVKVLQKAKPEPPLNLAAKVVNDPFPRLPYDITLEIMSHLPHQSWLNWLTASHRVYEESHQLAFWQRMFRIDILPWFPEIEPLFLECERSGLDDALQASMNIKRMYLYIQHATDPVAGRSGPLMGIANRRRIIKACQAFLDPYLEYLNRSEDPTSVS